MDSPLFFTNYLKKLLSPTGKDQPLTSPQRDALLTAIKRGTFSTINDHGFISFNPYKK